MYFYLLPKLFPSLFPLVQKQPKQNTDHLTVMSLGLVEPGQVARTRRLPVVQGVRHVLLKRSLDEAKAANPVSICYAPIQSASLTIESQLVTVVKESNVFMFQSQSNPSSWHHSTTLLAHAREEVWMGPPDRRRRAPRDKFSMPLIHDLNVPMNIPVCLNLDRMRPHPPHTCQLPSTSPLPLLDQHLPFSGHCLQHDQSPPFEVSAACPVSPVNACYAPNIIFFSIFFEIFKKILKILRRF